VSEFTYERLRENLERLKMKNTLEIIDNYLERAIADNINVVEILDHIFSEEAKAKHKRAIEKQIQMSGFPLKKGLDDFDFSFQPSIDKRQIEGLAPMRLLPDATRKHPPYSRPTRRSRSGTTSSRMSPSHQRCSTGCSTTAVSFIKGESYRLKERKEYLRQKIQATNALLETAS